MKLNYMQLISSDPIEISGVGHIVPPTLQKAHRLGYTNGQSNYDGMLTTILITPKQYFEAIGQAELFDDFLSENNGNTTMFDIWLQSDEGRRALEKSLSFFIKEKIVFNKDLNCFDVIKEYLHKQEKHKKILGHINSVSFLEVKDVIQKLCYMSESEFENAKPKNKRAEEILAKLNKAKASKRKSTNPNMEIGNIMSALCVTHNSYNFTNIWSLTVYQLYDQFERQGLKNQVDINAMRWSAWGKDSFDFSLWYKNMQNESK